MGAIRTSSLVRPTDFANHSLRIIGECEADIPAPTSTNAVLSETHRTWNRPEAAELAKLYALVAPNFAAVIESYEKAQNVAKQSR